MARPAVSRVACLVLSAGLANFAGAAPVAPELALSPASGPMQPAPSLAAVLERQARERALAEASRPDAGYQKQTAFDNTPYRFNMKPGEKMNAEQFEAWMASRGIRIVPAKPAAAQTVAQ